MLTIDRELLDADGLPRTDTLEAILRKHDHQRERLERLHGVYAREHSITRRIRLKGLPNNRLVHDLPGYIANDGSGIPGGQSRQVYSGGGAGGGVCAGTGGL